MGVFLPPLGAPHDDDDDVLNPALIHLTGARERRGRRADLIIRVIRFDALTSPRKQTIIERLTSYFASTLRGKKNTCFSLFL